MAWAVTKEQRIWLIKHGVTAIKKAGRPIKAREIADALQEAREEAGATDSWPKKGHVSSVLYQYQTTDLTINYDRELCIWTYDPDKAAHEKTD
ncbi:MAG: hypothetical protein GY700_06645 [Propionibacteriaceae bacterium]|nr:hypothetical protein [Propionibacteriaceae bacterium]